MAYVATARGLTGAMGDAGDPGYLQMNQYNNRPVHTVRETTAGPVLRGAADASALDVAGAVGSTLVETLAGLTTKPLRDGLRNGGKAIGGDFGGAVGDLVGSVPDMVANALAHPYVALEGAGDAIFTDGQAKLANTLSRLTGSDVPWIEDWARDTRYAMRGRYAAMAEMDPSELTAYEGGEFGSWFIPGVGVAYMTNNLADSIVTDARKVLRDEPDAGAATRTEAILLAAFAAAGRLKGRGRGGDFLSSVLQVGAMSNGDKLLPDGFESDLDHRIRMEEEAELIVTKAGIEAADTVKRIRNLTETLYGDTARGQRIGQTVPESTVLDYLAEELGAMPDDLRKNYAEYVDRTSSQKGSRDRDIITGLMWQELSQDKDFINRTPDVGRYFRTLYDTPDAWDRFGAREALTRAEKNARARLVDLYLYDTYIGSATNQLRYAVKTMKGHTVPVDEVLKDGSRKLGGLLLGRGWDDAKRRRAERNGSNR